MLTTPINYVPSSSHGGPPPSKQETRQPPQPTLAPVVRLINVIPVGLREAALDSPTSRASAIYFGDQVDLIEKWLEEYMKSTNRLIAESATLENLVNNFISHGMLPANISEVALDQDYSFLAIRKHSEMAKDYWMSTIVVIKRLTSLVIDPIKSFLQNEIRAFKDVRRNLEQTQKIFDALQNKNAALGKSKEPSSLREDAFQLHEARKAYLKAAMEFFLITPQLRFSLDKLLVRIFFDQWREMRNSRENGTAAFARSAQEMERVKGWTREMENSEKGFRKELHLVRKELEDAAELNTRPSRELDDYAISSIPNMTRLAHPNAPTTPSKLSGRPALQAAEKQGWLYLRTYTGKPTRTVWSRKWAFVRNGIFGWLIQGTRANGVEESEHIGVLLCNVRPAISEERRFCFEVKTKKHAIMLQAESQLELSEWISVFETAKSKALENPKTTDDLPSGGVENSEAAFSISAPPIPEFGTSVLSSLDPGAADELTVGERSATLPIPGQESTKESMDLSRRVPSFSRDDDSREPTSRIARKLDLHRKSNATQLSSSPSNPALGGGIASLIAASHGSMPVGPGVPIVPADIPTLKPRSTFTLALRDMPPSTLAPSTLANPPAATGLSKTAVIIAGERGLGASSSSNSTIPNGVMANMWGSSDGAFVNRLDRGDANQEPKTAEQSTPIVHPTGSPGKGPIPSLPRDASTKSTLSSVDLPLPQYPAGSRTPSPGRWQRSTISLDDTSARQVRAALTTIEYPNYYPLQLKTQDAQFRLLFPNARKDERLVLVFRATWNPNDQQDFPGRAYVTAKEIYFYSNHLGLVLATGVALSTIDEVTAAPGRDCDFLFLHLKEARPDSISTRVTIKTFLEPLRLLQRRLNMLVQNSVADEPENLENVIKKLIKMEHDVPERSPSLESWEDVSPIQAGDDAHGHRRGRSGTNTSDYKAPVSIDKTLGRAHRSNTAGSKEVVKFKLPTQPVDYKPPGQPHVAVEQNFEISPKALFHVLFGDKSAVWQLLLHERRAKYLKQGPWINLGEGRLRRYFELTVPTPKVLGGEKLADVRDYQSVDVNNDHLCYVVTDKRTAWHLPYREDYRLVSKIVITHVAKSKCKLAIFTKVEWLRQPWFMKGIIEQYAMHDLNLDALDLTDLVADQVRKLGPRSRTKKAIEIFGHLGQLTEITEMKVDAASINIEFRRSPVSRTSYDLVLQYTEMILGNALTALTEVLLEVLKRVYNVCSAHTLLLTLLLLSTLFNAFFSYRDTVGWWHERNAGKFMSRLGVTPNTVMSKAIYMQDIDELIGPQINDSFPSPEASPCYSLFHAEHQLDDLNAPLLSTATHYSTSDSAQRIQRTRQRLGIYRHDLVVAMRLLNQVEREVLYAEWEQWVLSETRRCRQVEALLGKNDKGVAAAAPAAEDKGGAGPGEKLFAGTQKGSEAKKWFDEYCGSCAAEHERLSISSRKV